MTNQTKRHATLRAIVRGSSLYPQSVEFNQVDAELDELGRLGRIQPERRKRLLQGLHSTRALDTCTGIVLTINGVSPEHSLGPRLTQLGNLPAGCRGNMPQSTIDLFRKSICGKRNLYVHKANHFPSSANEINTLVANVGTLLVAMM